MATPFPFIVGSGRSGTTLLREMLISGSQIAIPWESRFITRYARHRHRWEGEGTFDVDGFLRDLYAYDRFQRWRIEIDDLRAAMNEPPVTDYPEAIRRLYRFHAEQNGKPRYGDKTPVYATDITTLSMLFPEAKFIHAVRDGRNVVLSLLELGFGPKTVGGSALYWRNRVREARIQARALPPGRYFEYRHEDLVEDPPTMLKRICQFLDLPFEEEMLEYHQKAKPSQRKGREGLVKPPTKNMRDWRKAMSTQDQRLFEILAGDLLTDLGYERATGRRTAGWREPVIQLQAKRHIYQHFKREERSFEHRNRAPDA